MAGFWELPHTDELPGLRGIRQQGAFRHTIVNTVFEVQVCSGTLRTPPAGMQWTDVLHNATPVTTISKKALDLASGFIINRRGAEATE